MLNKNKIAFFDFCETLVDFQTADAFIDYVRNVEKTKRMLFWEQCFIILKKTKIIPLCEKLTFYKFSLSKRIKLFQLKGLTKEQVEGYSKLYYSEVIKQHLITVMIDKMKQCALDGYEIVIVSGGYNEYLKHFCLEYQVDDVISSHIKFSNGICLGELDGLDCVNKNKVTLLLQKYSNRQVGSQAYSDSKSDIPFLRWAEDSYVVSRNLPQKWNKTSNYKEIIWTEKGN